MDHVVETCHRLLALQKRAATPGEAQAAAGALARLIERHRLTMAEVEGAGGAGGPVLMPSPIYECKRTEPWRRQLIGGLCHHFGVAAWSDVLRVKGCGSLPRVMSTKVYLCGRPSDVECVRSMYAWLGTEAERLALLSVPDGTDRRRARSRRRSWLIGFANGIYTQLHAARDEAHHAPGVSSKAIVKLDGRYDEALGAIESAFKDIKNVGARRATVETTAYMAGAEAGLAVHLGPRLGTEGDHPV
jgi:hypothetical protein